MNDWFKLRLIHYITNTITSSLHFTLYLLSNTLTLNNLHCHKSDKSYISFQNIASGRNNWLHMLQHCTAWQRGGMIVTCIQCNFSIIIADLISLSCVLRNLEELMYVKCKMKWNVVKQPQAVCSLLFSFWWITDSDDLQALGDILNAPYITKVLRSEESRLAL